MKLSKMTKTYYDHLKVRVTYPDGKNTHSTTIGELKERFKEESKDWRETFLKSIVTEGVSHTRFGTYELVED